MNITLTAENSQKSLKRLHDESIYDYDSDWQTNSDTFYIRYSCDFDKDLKTCYGIIRFQLAL